MSAEAAETQQDDVWDDVFYVAVAMVYADDGAAMMRDDVAALAQGPCQAKMVTAGLLLSLSPSLRDGYVDIMPVHTNLGMYTCVQKDMLRHA